MRVIRVLAEIRDGINDIAGSQEKSAINEVIDIGFIETQTEKALYDWDSCKRLVGQVLAIIQRIQSPKRDAETMERWKIVAIEMQNSDHGEKKPEAFCQALEFLLDRLSILRIDAANTRSTKSTLSFSF